MSEQDFINRWSMHWVHHPQKEAITTQFEKELHDLMEPVKAECSRLLGDVWKWNEKLRKLQEENDQLKANWMDHSVNTTRNENERSPE